MEATISTAATSTVTSRSMLFQALYEEAFPGVAAFVSRMGGSFHDAKDVFQDALVIYHEQSLRDGFEVHTVPAAYVLGIAKHLWLRHHHNDVNKVSLDNLERSIVISEEFFPTPAEHRIVTLLERVGNRCMNLLRAFYYNRQSLQDIAHNGGYASIRSATVQKFKCLEKVRAFVKQKAMQYDDFME